MTRRRVIAVLAAAVLTVACGVKADGPPSIEVDRTLCSHCGMLISEPVYAAAYRAPGSEPRVFDDIKCLLEAAREEPRADAVRYWFHDAESGAWIGGEHAAFVGSPHLRTPMGGGTIAFRDHAAARTAAVRYQDATVTESIGELRKKVQ